MDEFAVAKHFVLKRNYRKISDTFMVETYNLRC